MANEQQQCGQSFARAGHAVEDSVRLAEQILELGPDPYAYGRQPTSRPTKMNGVGYGYEPQPQQK